jgi:hypothetical protein
MMAINEPDWKRLRKLRPIALNRFCERILSELQGMCAEPCESKHALYLKVYRAIEKRDREINRTFDNPRRSVAFEHLAAMLELGLVTEQEFEEFSSELRSMIKLLLGDFKAFMKASVVSHKYLE